MRFDHKTLRVSRRRSERFFEAVGCADDAGVLECLRRLPVETLSAHEWGAAADTFFTVPWSVTVDGTFITDTPHNILAVSASIVVVIARRALLLDVRAGDFSFICFKSFFPQFAVFGPQMLVWLCKNETIVWFSAGPKPCWHPHFCVAS